MFVYTGFMLAKSASSSRDCSTGLVSPHCLLGRPTRNCSFPYGCINER